jgi:hypothetical protein
LKIYVSLVFQILLVNKHADMGREIEITKYHSSRKLKNYEPFIDRASQVTRHVLQVIDVV